MRKSISRSAGLSYWKTAKKIAACLGIEKFRGGKGLLRSLVMSDRLNQSHIVTLFQSMDVLCKNMRFKMST